MKKTLLATAILLATSAANAAWTSPDGSLTIGGDAEINFDVVDRSYENRPNNGDNNPEIELNDDSRVKMMVQWDTTREDGSYISAKIEPLMKTNGTVALDDAYLMFGRKDSWAFQIGRYEAMNLFPLGKDVALFMLMALTALVAASITTWRKRAVVVVVMLVKLVLSARWATGLPKFLLFTGKPKAYSKAAKSI